jgi:hypothetical protein
VLHTASSNAAAQHALSCKLSCSEQERRSGARRGLARAHAYNEVGRALEVTVVEPAQIADARDCCGERYLLVELQQGVLVRRWFTHADDPDQRPITACARCAVPLLPHPAAELLTRD